MADMIQLRRDTAANWTSANPILAQGEPGLETDTLKIKMGDGSTTWNLLSYYTLDSVYDGYVKVYLQATAPTVDVRVGDQWVNTNTLVSFRWLHDGTRGYWFEYSGVSVVTGLIG